MKEDGRKRRRQNNKEDGRVLDRKMVGYWTGN
jgi:hypothetical protein